MNETFVRLGKSALPSTSGPMRARSSASTSSPTSITHCGFPMCTCWKANSRPPATTVPRPSSGPEGKSGERRRARPISTLTVRSEVIVGRISPAAVSIENSSASVHPWRRR